ncbi:MAG: hypothetical protein FWD53_02205 [Phycisphaerales bacterium]|nr:hypothetical protein [Phycisphaerales bacterium]
MSEEAEIYGSETELFPDSLRGGIAIAVALLLAVGGGALLVVGLGEAVMKGWDGAAVSVIAGAAMMVLGAPLGFYGMRMLHRGAIRRRHPQEPWLWSVQWAHGRIECADRANVATNYLWGTVLLCVGLLLFATFGVNQLRKANAAREDAKARHAQLEQKANQAVGKLNEIMRSNGKSEIAPVKVPDHLLRSKRSKEPVDAVVVLALASLLTGATFLFRASRSTGYLLKFGTSALELATFPGVIGGQLVGVIYTQHKIPATDGYHLRLRCLQRVVVDSGFTIGRKRRRYVTEMPIWEAEGTMARGVMEHDMSRTAIPVGFRIPGHCRPSDLTTFDGSVRWELQVLAKVPGVNYRATFVVPVFHTEDSTMEEPVDQVDPVAAYRAP